MKKLKQQIGRWLLDLGYKLYPGIPPENQINLIEHKLGIKTIQVSGRYMQIPKKYLKRRIAEDIIRELIANDGISIKTNDMKNLLDTKLYKGTLYYIDPKEYERTKIS